MRARARETRRRCAPPAATGCVGYPWGEREFYNAGSIALRPWILSAVPLPPGWTLSGLLLAAPGLAAASPQAPWDRFASSEITHVFYGGIFATVLLWSLRATVGEGFAFHLLGIGAFTLLAGPALALIGSAVALAVMTAIGGGLWINAGLTFITLAAVPIAVVWLTWRGVERLLPPNFFVYIFATAFLGSALALGAAGLAGSFVLVEAAGRDAAVVYGDYAAVPALPRVRGGHARGNDHHAARRLSPRLGDDVRRREVPDGPVTAGAVADGGTGPAPRAGCGAPRRLRPSAGRTGPGRMRREACSRDAVPRPGGRRSMRCGACDAGHRKRSRKRL